MALFWTDAGRGDLVRLHAFLQPVSPTAAARVVRTLLEGVRQIATHPRLGRRLTEFNPREVRRLLVVDYEVRYEIRDSDIYVLRLWHMLEDR